VVAPPAGAWPDEPPDAPDSSGSSSPPGWSEPPSGRDPRVPPAGAGGSGRSRSGRTVVVAGLAVAVVLAGTAVAVSVGRDDDSGGGCLSSLADHLPAEADLVLGSDQDRARDAGIEVEGSLEDLSATARDTGFQFDPFTQTRIVVVETEIDAGFDPEDVRCWAGSPGGGRFVARGRFDPDRLAGANAGDGAAVEGDLLAVLLDGDPTTLLGDAQVPAARAELIRSLDRRGAVTFGGASMSGGPGIAGGDYPAEDEAAWVGFGLADGGGDDWDLVLVWSFSTTDQAAAAREAVVEAVGSGQVPDLIDGDIDRLVEQDGSSLWLRARYMDEPSTWPRLLRDLDPAVTPFDGDGDGDGG
jgi:hypothetical protein